MRTPLAWHNLTYNKLRTAVAVDGVGFAVLLIFMQLGFLGAVTLTCVHTPRRCGAPVRACTVRPFSEL